MEEWGSARGNRSLKGEAEGLPCSARSSELEFGVLGVGSQVLDVGFRVQGSGFRWVAVHDELRHGFADLQRDLF